VIFVVPLVAARMFIDLINGHRTQRRYSESGQGNANEYRGWAVGEDVIRVWRAF
jgi:hypothetical protein